MPEISVIVPVYKAEAYLHRCVDSILAQSFTDFELILVDDGSPDRSGSICDEYAQKDSRVRVIHKSNGGVSSARNAGIDAANGNYIAFVDSDDYVKKTYLQNLYEPDYDLAVTGYTLINADGNPIQTFSLKPIACRSLNSNHLQMMLQLNQKTWMYFCWGRLYDIAIVRERDLRFDTRYHSGEDTVFMAKYFVCCDSVIIKSSFDYCYVKHEKGSLSSTYDVSFFESMLQTEDIVAQTMEARFDMRFPRKTENELCQIYAGALGDIAANHNFSFCQKLNIFRYLFKKQYFIKATDAPDIYFNGVSPIYKMFLRIRNPLLMLIALRVRARIRKNKE